MSNSFFQFATKYRRLLIVASHAGVFAVAVWLAFQLRFDFSVPPVMAEIFWLSLPVFLITKLVVFGAFRQFSGWWRYVTLDDLLELSKATVVAAVLVPALLYLVGQRGFPRSVFALDAILSMIGLSAVRVSIRLLRERVLGRGGQSRSDATRTLVAGTGTTAESLIREAQRNPAIHMRILGIVEPPDGTLSGSRMGNIPILGDIEQIPRLARELEIQQVVLAFDAGHGDHVRRVVSLARSADVRHSILPPTDALLEGRVEMSRLREVSLQDLLGREPVRLESAEIAQLINGETVLVTGAGGSIGSELCRQVAGFGPGRIVLLEQAENPLFELERELMASHPKLRLEPVIADVHDGERIEQVMLRHRPRIVLHAAAHKHVPLMELNPSEAVKNNIIGTMNVIRASQTADVGAMILISTDKAVNPTSVMGAAKRVAEMLIQSLARESNTRLAAVRFGNVLGSNGSVIPIFKQQIAAGGPVTVTHPEMRRYFMTIPEATQLVLQAATYAADGEVFVLDMQEPVRILDIARDLIRLSGLEPDEDIEIVFTGIRPGEKLFEELSTADETTDRTGHDRIFRGRMTPPEAEDVLDAVAQLRDLAGSDLPPAQMRRALFDVLSVLEERGSRDRIRTIVDNVIHLEELTNSSAKSKPIR